MALFEDPSFWTGTGLVLFIALLVYYGVPGQIAKALDTRRFAIRDELDQARQLREEAQALLATNQRRQRDALGEAKDIVASARKEVERAIEEARADLTELIERRRKSALDRIDRAEAKAVADVRAFAASVSVSAARSIVRTQMTKERDAKIVGAAIQELDTKFRRG